MQALINALADFCVSANLFVVISATKTLVKQFLPLKIVPCLGSDTISLISLFISSHYKYLGVTFRISCTSSFRNYCQRQGTV